MSKKVICTCYGENYIFNNIQDAMEFFLDCMAHSEGAEQNRYTRIFLQLSAGNTICSDRY